MIRRTSRRLAFRARAVQDARAHLAELEAETMAELDRLNAELEAKRERESRPTRRAVDVLAWASRSAEVLNRYGEETGDLAALDGVAGKVLDTVRMAVEMAVPAILEEEAPSFGRENVAHFVTVALEALKAEGAPIVPAIPTIAAILSWHVGVYDATARLDVRALHRLAVLAPYANARHLAEMLYGALGPVVDAMASRFVCRLARTVELGHTVSARHASRCRRRGPPKALTATPTTSRHLVGTSPNAPPTGPRYGAVVGAHVRRGKARGVPHRT